MFPTLSEYNKTIQVQGANAFRTLNNIFFNSNEELSSNFVIQVPNSLNQVE